MTVPPKVLKRHVKSRATEAAALPIGDSDPTPVRPVARPRIVPADSDPALDPATTQPVEKNVVHAGKDLARSKSRAPAKASSTESLPVLEAFQEFLDHERRRTRNRIAMLTACFLITLLVITGGGLVVGKLFMEQVQDDFDDVRAQVRVGADTVTAAKLNIEEALSRMKDESSELQETFEAAQQRLQDTQTRIQDQAQSQESGFSEIKGVIDLLKIENEDLKKDLIAMQDHWRTFLRDQQILANRTPPEPSQPVGPLPPPPQLPLGNATQTIAFSILPLGSDQAVNWRMAIPE